jgi:hypothetical protein
MGKWTVVPAWTCSALLGLASACTAESTERGKGGAAEAGVQGEGSRVRGTVSAVYPSELVIEDAKGRWHHLHLATDTVVRTEGHSSSLLDVREGVQLEALYVRDNGALRAIELNVARTQ